jgi:hypothetical protein
VAPFPAGPLADAAPAAAGVAAPPGSGTVAVREIAAFAELQTLAEEMTASFVFLPPRPPDPDTPPTAPMEGAARTLAGQGQSIGLFTLKADSPDYARVAVKTPPPAVLAMVKAGGMQAVTGSITEAKLIQAFLAASGAGACGPSGCGPGASGCK